MTSEDRQWYLDRIKKYGFSAEADGFTNQISMLVKFSSLLETIHQLNPVRVVDLGAGVGLFGKCLPVECKYEAVDALYNDPDVVDLVTENLPNAVIDDRELQNYQDCYPCDGTVYVLSMVSQDMDPEDFKSLIKRLCDTRSQVCIVIMSSYSHDPERDGYEIRGHDFDEVVQDVRSLCCIKSSSIRYYDNYGVIMLIPRK